MSDRKLAVGALTWSVAILLAAYLYRVLITDPQFVQTAKTASQSVPTQPVTVNQ